MGGVEEVDKKPLEWISGQSRAAVDEPAPGSAPALRAPAPDSVSQDARESFSPPLIIFETFRKTRLTPQTEHEDSDVRTDSVTGRSIASRSCLVTGSSQQSLGWLSQYPYVAHSVGHRTCLGQ